jgi:hypothetical protein
MITSKQDKEIWQKAIDHVLAKEKKLHEDYWFVEEQDGVSSVKFKPEVTTQIIIEHNKLVNEQELNEKQI